MNTFRLKKILVLALVMAGIVSCKKHFDVLPKTELDASQVYRDVYDANSAVMGIYGKFMGLADRYIILNELRGDLLQYTENADQFLRELSTHNVSPDNPYINPRPFYELIINCNDALKNFDIMLQKKTLKQDEYSQRYSDIACLRSFLYLQLGIHYGEVPYVTEALENITDINDPSRFPKLKFNDLLDALIKFTDNLPFLEDYPPAVGNSLSASLNIFLDNYSTQKIFINKKCFLGDLHLWKGNYSRAATYYKQIIDYNGSTGTGENFFSQYRMGTSDANYLVDYSRDGDASTLIMNDGWRGIFDSRALENEKRFGREWLWALPYDSRFKPANPLIALFSPIGGKYLVKPSKTIIDNWNNQQQNPVANAGAGTGIPYDARGLLSVSNIGGQPVVMKFIYDYINYATNTPYNPLNKNGRWFLYRQSHLYLRFAEAANAEGAIAPGLHRLAYALFNNGLRTNFQFPAGTPAVDQAKYQNTFFLPDVYRFDARQIDVPSAIRGPHHRNTGIRGRALLRNYQFPVGADSLTAIETGLIEEGALENAFEGTRWADLLRFALRRNNPAIIADRIADKLTKDGVGNAGAVRARLMNRDWYLPFKLQ
ncbi:MAG: RagB/SusD family nutrient uptake outer membrane protein [Chitinophagaceae bacterium]|nr:RagB/SusD family nutrient uptake outer membrane protein [Chitinophagaceae bacterium]